MGVLAAMVLVGIVLVGDGARRLDEKCASEVEQGIAENMKECRQYYIKEAK